MSVLLLRLVATVVYFPVHAAFVAVCFAVFLAFTLFAELLSWIPGVERAWDKTADACLNAIPMWPRWFVTVPELRHEGDAAFYRARLQRIFEHWQGGGTRWVKRNGRVFVLRVHKYRALPLDEVLRTARA
ncbi:MAG TPA: hypothetical protein VLH10_22780, partial [Yinghuangia sp.]|nr:hypothetical protein [Yinghuangia sp.]